MEGIQVAICDTLPLTQDALPALLRWPAVESVHEEFLVPRTRGKP